MLKELIKNLLILAFCHSPVALSGFTGLWQNQKWLTRHKEKLTAMESTRIALHEFRGPLNDLNAKLMNEDERSSAEWLAALKRFLRKENPWISAPYLKVWKTVSIGTHKNAGTLRQAILSKGRRISEWANDLMDQKAFTVAKTETKVGIAVLSVKELGEATGQDFSQGASYAAICGAIRQIGELCPPEVGPQLSLQRTEQSANVVVAMEPITASSRSPRVFIVRYDLDVVRLDCLYGSASDFWFPGRHFAFVLPRKSGE